MAENKDADIVQVETTSVFRADLLKEMENGAAAANDNVTSTENLPDGVALLVGEARTERWCKVPVGPGRNHRRSPS